VAAAAVGAWAGKGGAIASFIDGGWLFVTAAIGWQAYVEDEASLLVFDRILWKRVSSVPENLSLSMLSVHATADAVNRLAISSNASLFNNAGARASGEGEQAGGERYGKPFISDQLDRLRQNGAERQ